MLLHSNEACSNKTKKYQHTIHLFYKVSFFDDYQIIFCMLFTNLPFVDHTPSTPFLLEQVSEEIIKLLII
jgi:hypothetical protein